jgi:hypothetical protein
MSQTPRISVLIPTHDYARFLPEAVESVLAQDCANFELLISDDASSGDSAAIIRHYAAQDSRIRFHLHPAHLGMVANWNWCLGQARGDYVKFVFGDDCLATRASLGRLAALLDAHPAASLAVSARLIIDEQSRPLATCDPWRPAGCHAGLAVIGRCLWHDANLVGEPSAVMFRRAAAARGFDPQLHQMVDMEMWFHLLTTGDLVYDPEPLCAFRRHAAQQTVANRQSHVGPEDSLRIAARHLDLICSGAGGSLNSFQRRWILHRCLHYSRKRASRTSEILAAEAALGARLPPAWRFFCWLLHRLTKPLVNLRNRRSRHQSRTGRHPPLPPELQAWKPPAKLSAAKSPPQTPGAAGAE